MRKYIEPQNTIVDLDLDDVVLLTQSVGDISEEEGDTQDVKGESVFFGNSSSTPSRGSIWDNEW